MAEAWHVHEWGDPGAPPIVLIHGYAADGRVWAPIAERLAAAGRRVLAPDLPGHGGTPAPGPADDLATAAEGLACTLAALGVAAPLVLGYSLGGRLALHLALAHPPRALVLVGASAGLADAAERRARVEADARWIALLGRGLDAFLPAWEAQPLFAGRAPSPVRASQDPAGLAAAMAAFGTGRQAPLHDRLGELRIPVTLVAGERDAKFRAIAEDLKTRIPHANLVVAPDSGHDVPTDNPDSLLAIVASLAPEGALR